jgi:hypothetical protein
MPSPPQKKPVLKGDDRHKTVDVIKDGLHGNIEERFKALGTSKKPSSIK